MKKILLLTALILSNLTFAQTIIYTQDFELENTGYSSSTTEGTSNSFIDVFNRSNPDIGGNSTFIWSVEDTNATPSSISLDNIDVTGLSSFDFSIDLLARHYNDWDSDDEVLITYSLDGGPVQNLIWVQNTDNSFNEPAAIDTDFDGIGECTPETVLPALITGTADTCGATNNIFETFLSSEIALSGNSTLTISLSFNGFTSADEGIYLDNIEVRGYAAGPATTSLQFDPNTLMVNEDAGTVDLTVSISNESATAATTADVVLTSGTASSINNYSTQSITFPAGSSMNQIVTVTVTDDMIEELDKDFTFEIQNVQGGDMAAAGTNNTLTLTVLEDDIAPISLPYTESFDDCNDNKWVAFDQAGDDVWVCGSGAYTMNGFGGTDDIDWLITEVPVDFPTAASLNKIEVTTSERFGNSINEAGEFLLRYSTDYNGTGDPTLATWSDLVFDPNNTSSGNSPSASSLTTVDASAIQGQAYIAFLYDNTGIGAEEWVVEQIEITTLPANSNLAPTITNISNSPAAPASTDSVTVNVDVTDADGLSSVELQYGFASGVYDQTPVAMVLSSGDTYQATIPAQVDGTTVFYQIVAIDANASPETATCSEQNYTVLDPQPQGLQIDLVDTAYLIDFDNTVANVNNGAFDGSGFVTTPALGQLDADAFAISGLQDGTTNFGDEQSGNDFGKGTSDGGVGSGGIYAFEVAVNDFALGFQPTGSDFTPGIIELIFTNNTGAMITDLALAYDVYLYNNESRANDVTFSHGTDSSSLTLVSDSKVSSELNEDTSPQWERNLVTLELSSLSIPDGGTYVVAWTSTDQGSGSSDEIALDNIQIIANPNSSQVEASGTLESITLLGDLNLAGESSLNGSLNLISGNLTTNDNLIFKSIDGKSAVVGPVQNGAISGDVTVEQYFSAQRAFRFVGSTVNMTGSIFDNWQQVGLNPGDPNYVAGIGTQITGGTLSDGFDQSGTNAVSMFTFTNSATPQEWEEFSSVNNQSTNATSLMVGEPVRLFLRGDRSISLTATGAQTPTETTLSSTGTLFIGTFNASDLSAVEGGFNFVANPYQAQVDFEALYNDSETNDMVNAYYAWDPTIGDRGAYVTYSLSTSMNNVAGSEVNQFIQPGQAFFTETAEDASTAGLAPVLKFKESFKSSNPDTRNVYRNSNELITMSIFKNDEIASGKARDGVIISFDPNGNNLINSQDLIKFNNPDENLSVETLGASLSVTERAMPVDSEIIGLKLDGLTGLDYTFSINNALSSLQTIFIDHYLDTETVLATGQNNLSVSFDPNMPASFDVNRFSIKFTNDVLTIDDSAFAKAVKVYPNPLRISELTIDNLIAGKAIEINLYNMLGQKVAAYENSTSTGKETLVNLNSLKNGIYMVEVVQEDLTTTKKIIKN